MRILIIPDVHLKPWIFDRADKIDTSLYDNIVCVGDIADDWEKQNDRNTYEDTYIRLLEFYHKHKDALFCWGNHDISYMYYFQETGFSFHMAPTVNKYNDLIEKDLGTRAAIIHKIDSTIFSHAGLTESFVVNTLKLKNIDKVINKTNQMLTSKTKAEKLWKDDSPIWTRPQYSNAILTYGNKETIQYFNVIGHTPTKKPMNTEDFLSIDTFSTTSTGKPIGDEKLVIIDTITHEWEYAD